MSEVIYKMLQISLMGEALCFLLFCFIDDFPVPGFVGKKGRDEVSDRTMGFCKFVCVDRFHLYFNYLQVLEDDVPELVVETVDIHNVLESSGLEEYVVLAECERIAAEPIIIALGTSSMVRPRERRISSCSSIVLNSLPGIIRLLINKTPSSVHTFPQRPEGDVICILPQNKKMSRDKSAQNAAVKRAATGKCRPPADYMPR